MTTATATNIGRIVQIIAPVLDVEFQNEHLPELSNALAIRSTAVTVPEMLSLRLAV